MKVCVADLEADNLLDEATQIWCGVFKDINTGEITKFEPDEIPDMLTFMDTVDVLIMHNGLGYDWPLLEKLHGYVYKGKKVDTLAMSRLQKPDRPRPWGLKGKAGPHSVEAYGVLSGRSKPAHEDWSRFSPEMLHRCTEDVEIQHFAYKYLLEEAAGYEWKNAWLLSFKLFEVLQKQAEYGWKFDKAQAAKCQHFLTRWMNMIDKRVYPMLPHLCEKLEKKESGSQEHKWVKSPFLKSGKYNAHVKTYWGDGVDVVAGPHSRVKFRKVGLDKDKEVKDYLLSMGWKPAVWNKSKVTGEKTGPKLNGDDPFEGIEGGVGAIIAKRVVCKDRFSTIKGWLERTRADGRMASEISGFANTGRAKHKGLANVPNLDTFFGKWMRKCFIADEGKVLVGCDAAGCQDRMLANRAENQEFTDMLLNGDKAIGTDGHSLAMKAVNRAHERFSLAPVVRGKAKNYNFAFKFGASDAKLGAMGGGSPEAGKSVRVELEATFPAQAALVQRLTEEWRSNAQITTNGYSTRYKNGWVRGLDGRPIFVESEHAILVYVLQTDEAVVMAAAYVMLYKRLLAKGYKWGDDWAYVCWYHDEYTIECRKEIADEVASMAEQAIADAGAFFKLDHCPQIGQAEVGINWYEIH